MSSVLGVGRWVSAVALVLAAAACGGVADPGARSRAFVQLSGGEKTTCGVTTTGDAYCWGLDNAGTLGAPAPEQCDVADPLGGRPCSTRPQRVSGGHRFRTVSVGGEHVCGLAESGDVYCWGSNVTGTIGNGTRAPSATPVRVDAGPFTAVNAGLRHTCALAVGGEVDCWGDAGAGQLGVPIETLCPGSVGICGGTVPFRVATTQRFAAIHAGFDATCALTPAGEAWCWGSNTFGHLGDGAALSRATPAPVVGNHRFRSLSVGAASVCGVRTDEVGYCWGSNIGGVLGNGSETQSRVPVAVSGAVTFTDISVSRGNTIFTLACGLAQSGRAHCWGSNVDGALGVETAVGRCYDARLPDSQRVCSTTPIPVSGGLQFTAITTGFSSACGITFDGTAHCWGNNRYGALGNGSTVASSTPIQVIVP